MNSETSTIYYHSNFNENDIIFESTSEEPPNTPIINDIFNQTISESPSPTRRTQKPESDKPLEMQMIINSRPTPNLHSMEGFDNLGYVEFWNLSTDEGLVFKKWNKLEFERQNTIFEVFLHLKKIRFNLNRLVNTYGESFKGKFSKSDYEKTFGILKEFYNFLNKLILNKLKPLYDNQFIVNDLEIIKTLRNWFKLLKSKYKYISGSIMYLTQLTANQEMKKFINEINDPDLNNRSAVLPNELFHSYFIKLFTSVELLFNRLKKIYLEMDDSYLFTYSEQAETLIKEINNISDLTSDLEKKISFNEKLNYKTDIHYSYMEMIDMFNAKRVIKDPISIEMKSKLSWIDSKLVLFDNYLVPLKIKSNPLNLKDKEGLILTKRPIPLQYVQCDYSIDGNYKILKITDSGFNETYHFRTVNDFTSTILDKFVKLINEMQNDLFQRLNKQHEFKKINNDSFISKNITTSIKPIPLEYDPISRITTGGDGHDNDQFACTPSSLEYFSRRDTSGHYQRYCIIGTSQGIYMGIVNTRQSIRLMYNLSKVRSIFIHDDIVYCQSGSSIYKISIDKFFNDYYDDHIEQPKLSKDEHLNHINGFTIGYQSDTLGVGGTFLFTWDDKMVNYLDLTNFDSKWKQFKTNNKIYNLQTIYANNFGIGHVIDDEAMWCISNLNEFRFKPLINFDVKDILKNEIPVKIFKLPNKECSISETLIVYSRFAARFKSSMGKYKLSSPHIIWFGMECSDASFNIDDKVLFIAGKNSFEIYQLFEDLQLKSELIGCFIANNMKILNGQSPGKLTLSFKDPHRTDEVICETIVKIKKKRSKV